MKKLLMNQRGRIAQTGARNVPVMNRRTQKM